MEWNPLFCIKWTREEMGNIAVRKSWKQKTKAWLLFQLREFSSISKTKMNYNSEPMVNIRICMLKILLLHRKSKREKITESLFFNSPTAVVEFFHLRETFEHLIASLLNGETKCKRKKSGSKSLFWLLLAITLYSFDVYDARRKNWIRCCSNSNLRHWSNADRRSE